MGRRRNGNRTNRRHFSEAARVAASISAKSYEKRFQDTLKYQKDKLAQSEYLSKIAIVEQDILSRTIFVTQVKDLKQPANLAGLKRFFESNYGPVEQCVTAQFTGKKKKKNRHHNFPPARVRFLKKEDAEKIFGKELIFARAEGSVDVVGCLVAHGRSMKVRPSDPYPNMAQEFISGSQLEFKASTMALGHWFSAREEDSYYNVVSDGEKETTNLWLEETMRSCHPTVQIDFQKRTVEIELHDDDDDDQERSLTDVILSALTKKWISFRFKDLLGPIEFFQAESILFFRLKYPPKLYKHSRVAVLNFSNEPIEMKGNREIELCGIETHTFGGCLGYKLTLDRTAISLLQLNKEAMERMERFGIWEDNPSWFSTTSLLVSQKKELHDKLSRIAIYKAGLLLRVLLDTGKLCWYHALIDRGRVAPTDVDQDIFQLIHMTPNDITCRVLQKMSGLYGQTRFSASLFAKLVSSESEESVNVYSEAFVPSHCVELPRVLVTPTRVAVIGFQVEMSNRVVRKFVVDEGYLPDRFLRLSLGDENEDKLYSDELTTPVETRLLSLILSGITINGRTYRFLAYSSSQLKELSLWMVAPLAISSVSRIRDWMGDFSNCKTPSKYAARMGQCFSTTVQTLASSVERTFSGTRIAVNDRHPDVINYIDDKEKCHSDGTGLIKKEHMTELLKHLPFAPSDLSTVSIIQVRFGGAKGTLTAWDFPQLQTAIRKTSARGGNISTSYDVHLRPSMVKFEAPYRRLEVVSIGAHVPYYLNRNVVLLLGVHGVPDALFLDMQRRMLDLLDMMLRDAATAAELVPRLSGPDSTLTAAIVHMISAGLSPESEPFLFSVLHAIRTHHLTNLRKKSRIFVSDGAVLMGGMDETGLVPEGCIFVQVRHGVTDEMKPLVGPVMVTKHPVMHPGDVRMLLAVDIPELRDHKNVVLFSQWGMRPEADKMAGSDLDGDQFAVTWDSRLFLKEWNCCNKSANGVWTSKYGRTVSLQNWKRDVQYLEIANAEPMDYNPPSTISPTDESGAISDEKIIEHFVKHAKSDNLGRISTMWLDYAAKYKADCSQCIQLAGLHSTAVDFPKSGISAKIPDDLYIGRGEARPHWRERKDVPSYHCEGLLGKLYDEVVDRGSQNLFVDQLASAGRQIDQHGQILCFVERRHTFGRLLHQIYQPYIGAKLGLSLEEVDEAEDSDLLMSANCRRSEYDTGLLSLMSKYHLRSEGELLTGCIRKHHRLNKRRRHDLSEEIKNQCKELRNAHRQAFFEEVLELADPEARIDLENEGDTGERYEELLMTVERMATDKLLPGDDDGLEFLHHRVRRYARKLAAAMYMVTYNPAMRLQEDKHVVLFSFPWIVADVIAIGVNATFANDDDDE